MAGNMHAIEAVPQTWYTPAAQHVSDVKSISGVFSLVWAPPQTPSPSLPECLFPQCSTKIGRIAYNSDTAEPMQTLLLLKLRLSSVQVWGCVPS